MAVPDIQAPDPVMLRHIFMSRLLRLALTIVPSDTCFRNHLIRVFNRIESKHFLHRLSKITTMSEFNQLEEALGRVSIDDAPNTDEGLSAPDKPASESHVDPDNVASQAGAKWSSGDNIENTKKEVSMAVYYHPTCSLHRIPDHPEHYSRVDSILATLRNTWLDTVRFRESRSVTEDEILLFHTPALLARFRKLATKAMDTYRLKKSVVYLSIDMDTTVMWQTRPAAFHAAGAVVNALDDMYASPEAPNRIDTAFCCVRPPGHHAERDKSCGFCFFNNVAIGAKYAQKTHGVERVAILDFDVHHGNGTEEGFGDDPTVFYGSTHGRDHFPGTGHDPSPFVGEKAKEEMHRRIVDRELTPGPKSRDEFFEKWREILAEMERFQPDLVIMSTGFDAHDDDPLADCELQDEDYHWVTAEILASCGRVQAALGRPVRYLSVLEGGYDIPAICRSAVCHVTALLEGIPEAETADDEDFKAQCGSVVPPVGAPILPTGEGGGGQDAGAAKAEDGELAAMMEYLAECGITGEGGFNGDAPRGAAGGEGVGERSKET